MFDILLLELEPVCTAEQEFVQKFFDFTLDELEVCVFGHIVDYVQFVFLSADLFLLRLRSSVRVSFQ